MATTGVSSTGSTNSTDTYNTNPTGTNAFDSLNLDTFIKLMVAELQNQDPLNPMDNSEILQQVSQIRSIQSNQKLTDTLSAVLLGQNVSTGSSLIGRTIAGLNQDSKPITGQVDSVSIADGKTLLHVGQDEVELKNVSELMPQAAGS